MRLRILIFVAACGLPAAAVCRAGDSRQAPVLNAGASTDATEVHPDSVFEVMLTLENPTDAPETVKIPECGWDRVWKSSNRRVTWDAWECDDDEETTIEIAPHETYSFPKPLRMFVDPAVKKSHIDFRMGFKTRTFGKTIWSSPISLDVVP